jgi:hypothetical protein
MIWKPGFTAQTGKLRPAFAYWHLFLINILRGNGLKYYIINFALNHLLDGTIKSYLDTYNDICVTDLCKNLKQFQLISILRVSQGVLGIKGTRLLIWAFQSIELMFNKGTRHILQWEQSGKIIGKKGISKL